tara:strand:- start:2560 stop:3375 length:816 start_codon:yes stop_codon:yes gene_type:complete
MLENAMLIALGFLTATLFALIAVQLAWRRAVTLTTREFTENLDLEALKQKADRATMLDVTLQDRQLLVSELQAKNAELEQTLANARNDAVQLNNDIADLQAHHSVTQAEAEAHLRELTQLQTRVDDLEAAARGEVERRGLVEAHLKTLGETASRLIADMSSVATEIGSAQTLLTAKTNIAPPPPKPQTTPAAEPAAAKIMLAPFPTDDDDNLDDDTLPDLAKIKAELSDLDEVDMSDPTADTAPQKGAPTATEGFFADRIRALAAGVNAQA